MPGSREAQEALDPGPAEESREDHGGGESPAEAASPRPVGRESRAKCPRDPGRTARS